MAKKGSVSTKGGGTALEKLILTAGDIVIPVMGPTGAGKSTFINAILEAEHRSSEAPCLMEVGRGLRSCTSEIKASKIRAPDDLLVYQAIRDRSVVIVDTPGFDDTYKDDVEILQKIADWLKKSYDNKHTLAGVIYLHDISQDRFTGSVRRNLEIFKHLCGEDAFSKVVIVTTKAEKLEKNVAQKYEHELRTEYWGDIIQAGVTVKSFNRDYSSARLTVDHILKAVTKKFILQLQKEVAEDNKLLPATKAGRLLRYTLQQVLESQSSILDIELSMASAGVTSADEAEKRLVELREQLKILSAQVAALRLKSSSPLSRFFGRIFQVFS